jgi:hypothetical protein
MIGVGRGKVQELPARALAVAVLDRVLAVGRLDQPVGMLARAELVPDGGDIDRRLDADRLAGVDLRAQ